MNFGPIRKLEVWRYDLKGNHFLAGTLAQNKQGVFFQYADSYLKNGANLSPFTLHFDNRLQPAPKSPHGGLHGVFADSLPDGWGQLLMDRAFRKHGIAPTAITAMDRLAFVGNRATGALSYQPTSPYSVSDDGAPLSLQQLGKEAQTLFDGQTDDVLTALVAAGSSGGARPKAQLYFSPNDYTHCRTQPQTGDAPWLVKFTSQQLPLGHEEGLCEALWLTLASNAGIEVPEWQILSSQWLAMKRFDRTATGRYHLHSACGLLDADFRTPSLDYSDLIKAASMLCRSPEAGKAIFSRALFNLFAVNQDDHSKNWAFLQNDNGHWDVAPFYDVTFSPHPFGEHATAYAGFGKAPSLRAIQSLAEDANFSSWNEARKEIEAIVASIATMRETASAMQIKPATIQQLEKRLNTTFQDNRHLLVG